MNIKEINKVKKIIEIIKKDIISIDRHLNAQGLAKYNNQYKYSDAFTIDFKSIKLFTKDLLTNRQLNDNDIYINDYLIRLKVLIYISH
jgi:hypothetical protein